MSLDRKNLFALAKAVTSTTPSTSYSFGDKQYSHEELEDTFRAELNELAGTYQLYQENKNTIFALISETIDDILPKRVLEQYGQFAEIQTFAQGTKPVFTQKISAASKRRAMQFITKVGLAGRYEVFKLDGKSYEVPTSAWGGAAQIGFEEFLDGRITMSDVLDIVMEGLDRAVYLEIERALKGAVTSLAPANKHTDTQFDEAQMDRLLAVADSYGKATIYCTYEFAATMVPQNGQWIAESMKEQKWNNGYLANYKGHRVIVLDQSFEDETNSKKVIDPSYAWIIPAGSNDKPVKVAFEGQTQAREAENEDWSREIQVYKKMGVTAIITNNICVYQNTSLTY